MEKTEACSCCAHEHEHMHKHEHEHCAEKIGCSCGHDHSHGGVEKRAVVWLITAAVFFFAALLFPVVGTFKVILYLIAYAAAGWEVLLGAGRNILRGKVFDEQFLMAVASLGALALGDLPEGVAVMLFYQVGELFQSLAVGRSRKSIKDLMDIRPDRANRIIDGEAIECAAETIAPGDLILVKAGERIPLDGVVVDGESQLDTSALTGESMPRAVAKGQEVMAGCVNLSGTLKVNVTKPFGESTAAKILALVENAGANKAVAEQFITKFARYYTPAVVLIAAVIAVVPPVMGMGEWGDFIHRALTFLVISCPCALVISVPMGFFAGIGCASKNGILVKGGNYLEALCNAETVVFDKTGTLTQGKFRVTEIRRAALAEEELLYYAAHAEAFSNHPIAQSLRTAYGKEVEESRVTESTEFSGNGIQATIDGKQVLAGNLRLMGSRNIRVSAGEANGTAIYVAVDNIFGGLILIGDAPKKEAKIALQKLKSMGIKRTVMLTGDHKSTGDSVGREVGVDEVHAELLPAGKVAQVERLLVEKSTKGKLLFIGDGMNDAPVLARADVGIAMGGLGTDAAIEAADVVIMDDDLRRLPQAIQIARHTRSIVVQNILFALGVKLIFLTLGGMGMATMWEAVFADVGVSLLAVLNSMRALRTKLDAWS